MVEHPKKGLRTKVALGMAGFSLALTLACGGSKLPDPCDEAFQALQMAFQNSVLAAGNITDKLIEINPSIPGIATHPNVLTDGGEKNWSDVVMYLDLKCKDNYSVNYAGKGLNSFTEGVTVRRKPAQNFSLPETSTNGIGVMFLTIAAFLGLGTLGLGIGAKKLVGA